MAQRSQGVVAAAGALGSAAGRNIPLNNPGPAFLPAIFMAYVASATIGNRIPVVQLKDSNNNILWQAVATTAITASQTPKILWGAGIAFLSVANPLSQYVPLPVEMLLPANSSLQVFDAANIDTTDTVTATAVWQL